MLGQYIWGALIVASSGAGCGSGCGCLDDLGQVLLRGGLRGDGAHEGHKALQGLLLEHLQGRDKSGLLGSYRLLIMEQT